MTRELNVSNRARNLIVAGLAALYLGVCGWSIATTTGWIARPFAGFLVTERNVVAVFMLSSWGGPQAGLDSRDVVTAVNGQRLQSSKDLYAVVARTPVGTPLDYTAFRKGRELHFKIPVSVFTLADYLFIFVLIMCYGGLLYGMGLAVFYLKPRAPASWAFLFLGMMLGLTDAAAPEFYTNHVNAIPFLTYQLVSPAVILISLYFPVEVRRKLPFLLLAIAPPLVIMYLLQHYLPQPQVYRRVYMISVLCSYFLRAVGLGVMIYSFVAAKDPMTRQQGKVVVGGFAAAFLIICGLVLAEYFSQRINVFWTLLPWGIIPLALGYAMVKHNLFDVDVFLRRSVSYLVVSGVVVALFFALVTPLSLGLQNITGQSSPIASVVSTLVMVMLFRPLQGRLDAALDRRFFREKYQYTATIRKAGAILASIIDLHQLLRQLLDTVLDAVKIERGLILLKTGEPATFSPIVTGGYQTPETILALGPDHPIIRHLEAAGRAIAKNDVTELPEYRDDREALLGFLEDAGLVLALPILYERRLIGLFGLGEKKSGAWYSSEDIELLQTLTIQTAVSIENARKVEELKKMVELETSYRELQRLDEMKDNFLSMVSHDLRTPMTSIKGYAAILKEKQGRLDPARQDHYLGIIIKESDRLTRLINDLLDLQRFEAGKMKLEFVSLDLREIVGESAASFQGAAMAKKIEVEKEVPDAAVMVAADRDRLSQVMANLLSNAIKFTPAGGRVKVSVEKITVDGKPAVRVTVADNGPGIPKESQASLFDKFQQVKELVRGKEQGSGLGLALVREIVGHHRGQVGMESEPGQGSKFYFTLPEAM